MEADYARAWQAQFGARLRVGRAVQRLFGGRDVSQLADCSQANRFSGFGDWDQASQFSGSSRAIQSFCCCSSVSSVALRWPTS